MAIGSLFVRFAFAFFVDLVLPGATLGLQLLAELCAFFRLPLRGDPLDGFKYVLARFDFLLPNNPGRVQPSSA